MLFGLVLSVFMLTSSVNIVLADDPQPCTTPPQWESRYIESNERLKFYLNGNLSYDATNQRERVVYFVDMLFCLARYDTIFLHKENTAYIYSFKTGKCYKRPLKREWRDFGVPKEAKFDRKSYLGAASIPNANLLTNVWYGPIHDKRGRKLYYVGRFTDTGCLPINAYYMSKRLGTTSLNFIDITPGIADDKVFVPRPVCLNSPAVDVDKEDSEVEKYF